MRSFIIGITGACVCAAIAACGGAADTPLLGDGGTPSTNDGGNGDGTVTGDAATACAVTCATIPSGFHAVRLTDGNATCPQSWTSTPVVTSPTPADGACTCGCNVTQAPSCYGGTIGRSGDLTTTATCNTTQNVSQLTATAACSYTGTLQLYFDHYQTNPPPAQGGTCEFDAQTDSSKVTTTPMLVCQPPDSCVGQICGGAVCVASDGDVACPAGFATKTLVGKSASASCTTCTGTCTPQTTCNGTLSLYSDMNCTMGEVDFTADGTCDANPSADAVVDYAEFKPSPTTPTCVGKPTLPTASAALDSPTTVCCQ
jgi:hypothetical protein